MSFALPKTFTGFKGYTSDIDNASADRISDPSVNCMINDQGVVETRLGFEDTTWNLNNANKAHTSWYMSKYDITFFAGGTKVLYIDHNNANAVVDTGITLTAGTTTRFAEFEGDIYLTNVTDGVRRIVVMRLNDAAATSGDGTVTVDSDGAARLSVFGLTSGTGATSLRINGTNEPYSSLVVATGVVTLTGTLTQTYADNSIAIRVHDLSGVSGIEKLSKIFFWKRRFGGFGSQIASNADQPNSTIYYGKFSTPSAMENLIVFDYSTGGSVTEQVGNLGSVTNVIPVKDFLYQFTNEEAYVTAASDIVITGTGIGVTTPELRDENHGCINEDCAISLGNNEITYVTNDKRILRIRIADSNGAAVVFPDEEFDRPIRKLLAMMDEDQTGAFVYSHKAKRRTYYQLKLDGTWTTLCFDRNINDWQAPQTGKSFKSTFERKGILYATDMTDDTIYKIDSTFNDNAVWVECYIATGIFNVDDTMIDKIVLKGLITQPTTVTIKTPVNGIALDSTPAKTVVGSNFAYGEGSSLANVRLGSTSLASNVSDSADISRWKKVVDTAPSEANRIQVVTYCFGDSHHYGLSYMQIQGKSVPTFSKTE